MSTSLSSLKCSASSSQMGASCLQWPHQGASGRHVGERQIKTSNTCTYKIQQKHVCSYQKRRCWSSCLQVPSPHSGPSHPESLLWWDEARSRATRYLFIHLWRFTESSPSKYFWTKLVIFCESISVKFGTYRFMPSARLMRRMAGTYECGSEVWHIELKCMSQV